MFRFRKDSLKKISLLSLYTGVIGFHCFASSQLSNHLPAKFITAPSLSSHTCVLHTLIVSSGGAMHITCALHRHSNSVHTL